MNQLVLLRLRDRLMSLHQLSKTLIAPVTNNHSWLLNWKHFHQLKRLSVFPIYMLGSLNSQWKIIPYVSLN